MISIFVEISHMVMQRHFAGKYRLVDFSNKLFDKNVVDYQSIFFPSNNNNKNKSFLNDKFDTSECIHIFIFTFVGSDIFNWLSIKLNAGPVTYFLHSSMMLLMFLILFFPSFLVFLTLFFVDFFNLFRKLKI